MSMDTSVWKPCIKVVDKAIESLVDFRQKLASESFLEDVCASDEPIKSDLFFPSKSEFDKGYKSLRSLKDLDNVLAPLSRILGKKIREMNDVLLRPASYYGLASIPNEIFMHIMSFLAASCTRYEERMKLIKVLSSVCKRFRDGVVSTSSFWIYWDSQYCLDYGFEHRLARAKEASLFVDINARLYEGAVEDLFTTILPHKNRWRQLRITDLNKSETITTELHTADFPSVRSLEVNVHIPLSHFRPSLEFIDSFWAKWTFPNVCSIELFDIIPPPGVFPKATSLRLRNKYGDLYPDEQYLAKLTRSLATMPALLTLDLTVLPLRTKFQATECYTVELPSVITFRIGQRMSYIENFKQVLRLPNVEHYTLRLSFNAKEEEAWLLKLFPEGVSFGTVKEFHLIVASRVLKSFPLFFDGFSSCFPNIRTLHVEEFRFRNEIGGLGGSSVHLAETFDTLEGCLPHLRSLVVLDLEDDWFVFLEWFESLREKGAMIEHLSVTTGMDYVNLGLFKRDNINVNLVRRREW